MKRWAPVKGPKRPADDCEFGIPIEETAGPSLALAHQYFLLSLMLAEFIDPRLESFDSFNGRCESVLFRP